MCFPDLSSGSFMKIIPNNGLEKLLKQDNVEYYLVNDIININLDSCYDGLPLVNKYQEHIKEFEILRGDMDDVFLNITGRKLGDE